MKLAIRESAREVIYGVTRPQRHRTGTRFANALWLVRSRPAPARGSHYQFTIAIRQERAKLDIASRVPTGQQ